jgi:hypothetical protein
MRYRWVEQFAGPPETQEEARQTLDATFRTLMTAGVIQRYMIETIYMP